MSEIKNFKKEFINTLYSISDDKISELINQLFLLRKKSGRLFILGVGGSAGNASHAVNDFRKLCEIEAYAPTDNVSEITATTNDEGFENIFYNYLIRSKIKSKDALLIFSVGGGNKKKKISINLIKAINLAKKKKLKIFSIVGKRDGYAHKKSDISILVGAKSKKFLTPVAESLQAYIWHCLVSHSKLQINKTKW